MAVLTIKNLEIATGLTANDLTKLADKIDLGNRLKLNIPPPTEEIRRVWDPDFEVWDEIIESRVHPQEMDLKSRTAPPSNARDARRAQKSRSPASCDAGLL